LLDEHDALTLEVTREEDQNLTRGDGCAKLGRLVLDRALERLLDVIRRVKGRSLRLLTARAKESKREFTSSVIQFTHLAPLASLSVEQTRDARVPKNPKKSAAPNEQRSHHAASQRAPPCETRDANARDGSNGNVCIRSIASRARRRIAASVVRVLRSASYAVRVTLKPHRHPTPDSTATPTPTPRETRRSRTPREKNQKVDRSSASRRHLRHGDLTGERAARKGGRDAAARRPEGESPGVDCEDARATQK
jgi:hypothetical protein